MAKLEGRPTLQTSVTVVLTEEEAGALDALAGYGTDAFLDVFYKHMGKHYLQPYEKGLRSLFTSVRDGEAGVRVILERAKNARDVFSGVKDAVRKETR